MNWTTRVESARSVCEAAEYIKPRVQESFERLVLQNGVAELQQLIRQGDINAIEAEAELLRDLVDRHRKELNHAA